MEIKALLEKPYEEEARVEFIIKYNHRLGYEIRETETTLEAWGESVEELIQYKKEVLFQKATDDAKKAVEEGSVNYRGADFETNAQTVGDLTATTLLMQATGLEEYEWLSKDDVLIKMTVQDFQILGVGIAELKNNIWNVEYLAFKTQITNAKTMEDLNKIDIHYTNHKVIDTEE